MARARERSPKQRSHCVWTDSKEPVTKAREQRREQAKWGTTSGAHCWAKCMHGLPGYAWPRRGTSGLSTTLSLAWSEKLTFMHASSPPMYHSFDTSTQRKKLWFPPAPARDDTGGGKEYGLSIGRASLQSSTSHVSDRGRGASAWRVEVGGEGGDQARWAAEKSKPWDGTLYTKKTRILSTAHSRWHGPAEGSPWNYQVLFPRNPSHATAAKGNRYDGIQLLLSIVQRKTWPDCVIMHGRDVVRRDRRRRCGNDNFVVRVLLEITRHTQKPSR